MCRRITLFSIAALMFCVALANAQGPGGPGGPGRGGFPGFGGPGGFGGPPGFGPMGGSPSVMLLGLPEVRKELEIGEVQHKPLDELIAESQEQMRTLFQSNDFQELQNLNQEERDQRFAEMRKKGDENARQV